MRGRDGGCEGGCGAVGGHAGGCAVGGRLLLVRLCCLFRHGRGVVCVFVLVRACWSAKAGVCVVSVKGREGAKE